MRAVWDSWDQDADQQAQEQMRSAVTNGQKRVKAGGFSYDFREAKWTSAPEMMTSNQTAAENWPRMQSPPSDKQWDELRVRFFKHQMLDIASVVCIWILLVLLASRILSISRFSSAAGHTGLSWHISRCKIGHPL